MYRIQNTEYRIQNTEYRIQNTEYRIQNTEYRIQNTEYRIQCETTNEKILVFCDNNIYIDIVKKRATQVIK